MVGGREAFLLIHLLSMTGGQADEAEGSSFVDETRADDEGWDVDYIVNRPEVEEDEEECKWNCVDDCHWNCERPDEDLTPYKKYKSYKRWERRPLFVIIIGGLRWDYLIPEDTDYESEAETQNPELKAFNWIREHGTTMKQALTLAVSDSAL